MHVVGTKLSGPYEHFQGIFTVAHYLFIYFTFPPRFRSLICDWIECSFGIDLRYKCFHTASYLLVTFHVFKYRLLLARLLGCVWAGEQQRPTVVSSEHTAHEGKAERNFCLSYRIILWHKLLLTLKVAELPLLHTM